MNVENPALDAPRAARANPRFAYANGARPLEGYTIKRGIGSGGFGEVYFATSDGGKDVALKLIRRNLDVELRGVGHCLNLKHPHLVALYDVRQGGQDENWVVMEYVSGECLERVIARHPGGMPHQEVLAWLHGIAAGVAYLHDKGVVHRDLKPGNIFSDEGLVKIGDYGLSKFISASRRSGQTESVGTVHYMAPEISNGRYGKEIDIYALGIMLFEMLTGQVPFEGESVGEVLMKHLTATPDLGSLAEPYRTVVGRALAKDPTLRYRTVAEFMAGLPAASARVVQTLPQPDAAIADAASPFDKNGQADWQSPETQPAPVEEPLWRALQEAGSQLKDAWNRAGFGLPMKVLLLAAGMFVLFRTFAVTVPAVICGLVAYGGYRLVRALLMSQSGSTARFQTRPVRAAPRPRPSPPPLPDLFPPAAEGTPRHARAARHAIQLPPLPFKSRRDKVTELLGSLLVSSGVAAAVAVVMAVMSRTEIQPERFAWLALVGSAASWGVLVPSKLWEGRAGETLIRRCAMLFIGLAVGAFAWFVHQSLFVRLNWVAQPGMPVMDGYRLTLIGPEGVPLLKGYLVYFGLLFPVLRWWRQADPVRPTRLSLWSVAVCAGWAWMLGQVWPFPQPWGVMVAVTTAIATQLASPWVETRRRPLPAGTPVKL
ncbi:MAG: serine/threonine-protein kinase [Pirellulales bacterium]